MHEMTISDLLEDAKVKASSRKSQIEDWIDGDEDKREQIVQALEWFYTNRTSKFGWRLLYDTLKKQDGLENLPGNYQCLMHWAKDNLPGKF